MSEVGGEGEGASAAAGVPWPEAWTEIALDEPPQRVRRLGYWKSASEPELPDPHAFVDEKWDGDDRRAVLAYLREPSFEQPWAYGGSSPCRFCGKPNGNLESADGVYLWPSGLAHYLASHAVRLPDEFVRHALARAARGAPQSGSR